MDIIIIVGTFAKQSTTIGIRIPNVPHDVPVEKAKNTATRKIIAGRQYSNAPDIPAITMPTNNELYTSLVIKANMIATNGGTNA